MHGRNNRLNSCVSKARQTLKKRILGHGTCNIQITDYLSILFLIVYLTRRLFPPLVLPAKYGELGKDK